MELMMGIPFAMFLTVVTIRVIDDWLDDILKRKIKSWLKEE
jgi:hypothetical protein